MGSKKIHDITRLVGFDEDGEVISYDNKIYRGIYKENKQIYLSTYGTIKKGNLFRFGIIFTQLSRRNPFPDFSYSLIFKHKKIEFISYPYEWSSSMLKDAALFHLDLFKGLSPYGLTVKDWHPNNILFEKAQPVFIDFTSIIPESHLLKVKYLGLDQKLFLFDKIWDIKSSRLFEMYDRMFVPYFLFPLMLMHQNRHIEARQLMRDTALNTATEVIEVKQVFKYFNAEKIKYILDRINIKLSLIGDTSGKSVFINTLIKQIKRFKVTETTSSYVNYYSDKKEKFKFTLSQKWPNKQIAVYESIKTLKPATLLDIGCNTGWFSILAAKLGCKVVAVDIDAACIDMVYLRAKSEKLHILPLVLDITKESKDIYPIKYPEEPSKSLIKGEFPIILSSEKRIKCDMVLALAIVHHLVLGLGYSFEQVLALLGRYVKKYLVVEFVSVEDEKITSEPAFFQSYFKNPSKYDWYTLDNFIKVLKKRYKSISLKKSNPETRIILVCKK